MQKIIEGWLFGAALKIAGSAALAICSFLLGRFWLGFLQPWLQSFWWQGVHLDECYRGEFTLPGATQVGYDHIELTQKANTVKGTMTVANSRWGKYEFAARLDHNVLRGTWKSTGKGTDATGSFLLLVTPGSRELTGWCVEPINGQVAAYPYKWEVRK